VRVVSSSRGTSIVCRLLLSVAACSALAACSGGGSALNSGPAPTTSIVITTAGQQDLPRVLAGSSLPLSAVSTSGSNHGTVENNRYVWSATLVNGASYPTGQGASKPCAAITASAGGSAFAPYAPDYSIYITIDPSNESNIIFSPPLAIPVPAGTVLGPQSATNAYCVTITATQGATSGSVVVAVADPQNPLE
jgi:hypothetical protein